MKRKSIPPRLRFAVLRRDNYTCQYCGRKAPDVRLHVDHVEPVVRGGASVIGNLRTACVDCNQGKGADPLRDLVLEFELSDRFVPAVEWENFYHSDPYITSLFGPLCE